MLAPVAVHAHDQTVLILHTHLVVDVLLDAAAEKALKQEKKNRMKLVHQKQHIDESCHTDDH